MSGKYKTEFQEIRALGHGGFSTVFEAKPINDIKSYAIKKIPIKCEETEESLKEIEFIGKLNNDFVVYFIDSWIEDNYYIGTFDIYNRTENISSGNLLYSQFKPLLLHIQMELCSMTLKQFIGPPNATKLNDKMTKEKYSSICDIFVQLLECVNYLHAQSPPIIHRDLKPENTLLIDNDCGFKVKLTDFGLSTYHDYVDQSHTKYIGTTSYRAPEVLSKRYDTKADIFSLGKIMQELFDFAVDGQSNETEHEIQLLYENANQFCLQCLSVSPNQRPDCKQILSNTNLWNYRNESINKNEKDATCIKNILDQKWQNFGKDDSKTLNKCDMIAIFEEIEEKAIFVSKDGKVYALRISDHIDSASQREPNIINELINQEIKTIACGYCHVLCLTKDMNVYSFGENSAGQLGNGTLINNNTPAIIEELRNKRIIDIKCGAYHSMALSDFGAVFVWGGGKFGQIGNGMNYNVNTPTEVIALKPEKIVSIACGYNHCLALSSSGTLYAWGDYEANANVFISMKYKPNIIKFDEKIAVKKICCGGKHNLILTTDGDLYTFGDNSYCQLGIGNEISQNNPTKIQTSIKFIDIETTFNHSLSIGLGSNNLYYVWGKCNEKTFKSPKQTNFRSFYETFIFYSPNYKVFPTIIADQSNSSFINKINEWNVFKNVNQEFMFDIYSLSIVRLIESKAILLTNDDNVYSLRLSESIDTSADEPVICNELSKKRVKKIICGYNHVLCLTECYEVYSFGDNSYGQLGIGSLINNFKPTLISELSNKKIVEISCGAYHCLALSITRNLYAWGFDRYGQIGIGENHVQLTPIEIKSFNTNNILSIACGAHHCLALCSNGELYGWGHNSYGQLGIGNCINQNKPILADNRNKIAINKISCGFYHSLLLSNNDHAIYSFGQNTFGQLGTGDKTDRNLMAKVDSDIEFVDFECNWNENLSAALSRTGNFYIWSRFGERVITTPTKTEATSFNEIFLKFSELNFLTKHIELK